MREGCVTEATSIEPQGSVVRPGGCGPPSVEQAGGFEASGIGPRGPRAVPGAWREVTRM